MEETVRAFNHLIDQGKCFYWGTSEWNADEIAEAWGVADKLGMIGPLMEQPQYNMLAREKVEKEFSGLYGRHGLGLTIFSPLRAGILTGKYSEGIPKDSRLATSDNWAVQGMAQKIATPEGKKEVEKVQALKPIADKLGCSLAALAMAWVLKNPHVSSAITGASKPEQIAQTVRALEVLPKLTADVMEEIEKVLDNKPPPLIRRMG